MISKKHIFTAIFTLFACSAGLGAHPGFLCTEVDIGEPITDYQLKLSDQGAVVGEGWRKETDDWVQFIWNSPKDSHLFAEGMWISDVNATGHVVGILESEDQENTRCDLFVWHAQEGVQLISTQEKLGGKYKPLINDDNQVLFSTQADQYFWWDHGNITPMLLPAQLEGLSLYARAMNNAREVLLHDFNSQSWFVVKDGQIVQSRSEQGMDHFASCMNHLGDVAGSECVDDEDEPEAGVIWTHDQDHIQINIKNVDVDLNSINDSRHVVGEYWPADEDVVDGDGYPIAFLWTPEEGVILLNTLNHSKEWVLDYAVAINNQGQILAEGHRKDGSWEKTAPLLLTPQK